MGSNFHIGPQTLKLQLNNFFLPSALCSENANFHEIKILNQRSNNHEYQFDCHGLRFPKWGQTSRMDHGH